MEEEILWDKRGHIRIMTYNRPEVMNAITLGMLLKEEEYLEEFINDDDARVLIYRGAGRAFCTGLDIKSAQEIINFPRPLRVLTGDAPDIWKPIIAAVQGYAVGGGCELAMACDIRIAAEDARFGQPEVKLGLIAGGGGCQRLPRLVPLGNALMMLLTGDWIDAQEAYRIGLVQKVVPREKVLDETILLAEKICENAPVAQRVSKEAVYRDLEEPLRTVIAQKGRYNLQNAQLAPQDIEEGGKAFAEKRKPNFKGL